MQSNSPSAHHFEHQPDTQQTQAEELSNSQMPEHKLPDLHTHKSNSTPPNFALHAFRDRFPMLLSLKSHESSRLSPFDYDGFESDDDDVDSPQHESRVDIGSPLYTKLLIENDEMVKEDPRFREYLKASKSILNILGLRDQYIIPQSDYKHIQHLVEMKPPSSEPQINYLKNKHVPKKLENSQLKKVNGVFVPYLNEKPVCVYKTAIEHLADMRHILRETCDQATKAFCHKRLCLLSEKFKLHSLYNREKEFFEQKMNINRDFYNIRKIDNLIDHMASATVKTFVNFVVSRVKDERNMVVATDPETKKPITLEELFEKLQCKSKTITMENLEVQNYLESLRRYNRTGNSPVSVFGRLVGEVFLQRDNMINGKFLAELTKEMFREYETYKFQYSEFRIQVRGKNRDEWKKMAEWFNTHEIYNQHVRWLIQIPRKYEKYRKANVIKNFQEILDNIFEPLFEVTLNPEVDPGLHKFLLTVVGFDTVDDENGYNQSSHPGIFKLYPNQWIMEENPHFCYWAYYLWANIYTLNSLRKLRGLNTFAFRPHVGESGSVERLISVYLLANGISQGTHLNKIPLIQYLFYLKQIGISMTPLSDNKGLLKYKDNPFPDFFAKGLNVSLSTDRPLIHHMTEASLIEEYSISSQVFDLSLADICELARNSVRQCGFEHILKSYWIGDNYATLKANGNDQSKSNVPRARYLYRVETLEEELEELKAIIEVAGE